MVEIESRTIRLTTLPNGLMLLLEEMPWLPSASIQFLMPVGAATDPEGWEGSAAVLNEWLYRGAGALNSRELSDALDGLGVRRGGGSGTEYSTLSASLLASTLPEALRLYADILRRPLFPDAEFEPVRSLALQELAALDDNPSQRLFELLDRRYFASGHGRSAYGTEEGLLALEPAGVRADFDRRAGPEGMILSVAGGVIWDQLLPEVESAFGDWGGEGVPLPEVADRQADHSHIPADTSQVHIGVAYKGVAPGSPGWYENALANGVLSGGMGSRLFSEVREKRGLVYSVAAFNRSLKGYGYTLGYAGTTPERADETLEVFLGELKRIYEGVREDELERARTGLLSQLVMQGESSGARAGALARDAFLLDRPRSLSEIKESVRAIGVEDVNRFLASRPEPEFTVLTLGPERAEASA